MACTILERPSDSDSSMRLRTQGRAATTGETRVKEIYVPRHSSNDEKLAPVKTS